MQYSQGFNPRPRLSLPLPRSVAVESDDELLCLWIDKSTSTQANKSISDLSASMKTKLSQQLPESFELVSVKMTKAKSVPQPRVATYVLFVRQEYVNEKLKARIQRVLGSESINVQRRIYRKNLRPKTQDRRQSTENRRQKTVDVRSFLESVELDERGIVVECKIGSSGSVRVEEILKLLELDVEKLTAPIRRTNVRFVTGDS